MKTWQPGTRVLQQHACTESHVLVGSGGVEPSPPIGSTLPMHKTPTIGILGGMGPQAGLDLFQAVLDNTQAAGDQEHIPALLLSASHVPDRTAFLLGNAVQAARAAPADPAPPMADALVRLAQAGATVAAVACNTAHAEPIFRRVQEHVRAHAPELVLLHMIQETVRSIRPAPGTAAASAAAGAAMPGSGPKIGILATAGTYQLRLYDDALEAAGFTPLLPDARIREEYLFPAIYDAHFGIKAASSPVTKRAQQAITAAVEHLLEKGAERVILGCTELPLAFAGHNAPHPDVINPTQVVARALIRTTYPERLRPAPNSAP